MKNYMNFKSGYITLIKSFKNGFFLVSLLIFSQIIGCKSSNDAEKSNFKIDFNATEKVSKNKKTHAFNSENSLTLIPEKAYEIRNYVREKGVAKPGFVGGRKFKNLERRLPILDNNHLKIRYQEWDINRKVHGKNRGAERLVTASDGSDYYTNDHYKTFQKLKKK